MISFKITHQNGSGQTRRLTFPSNPSWFNLAFRAGSLFGISVENVAITYVDGDGDEITMSTQEELEEFYVADVDGDDRGVVRFGIRDLGFMRDALTMLDGEYELPVVNANSRDASVTHSFSSAPSVRSINTASRPESQTTTYTGPSFYEKAKYKAEIPDDSSDDSNDGSDDEVSLVDALHVPLVPTLAPNNNADNTADGTTAAVPQFDHFEEEEDMISVHSDSSINGPPTAVEDVHDNDDDQAHPSIEPTLNGQQVQTSAPASLENVMYNALVDHLRSFDFSSTLISHIRSQPLSLDRTAEAVADETERALERVKEEFMTHIVVRREVIGVVNETTVADYVSENERVEEDMDLGSEDDHATDIGMFSTSYLSI